MPGMTEGLRAINSFLRTLIAVAVLGGCGAAGYFGYTTYHAKAIAARQQEKELQERKRQLNEVSQQLQSAKLELENKNREIEAKDEEIVRLIHEGRKAMGAVAAAD